MRAKFYCSSVTRPLNGSDQATLTAVTDEVAENIGFTLVNAKGIAVTVNDPAAQGFLKPGATYYLDFTLAEAPKEEVSA
jgi:hypothetical protein